MHQKYGNLIFLPCFRGGAQWAEGFQLLTLNFIAKGSKTFGSQFSILNSQFSTLNSQLSTFNYNVRISNRSKFGHRSYVCS